MMEGIVAFLAALIGIFAYRFFGQKHVDAEQVKLEEKIEKLEKEDKKLQDKVKEIEKTEEEKIKEITDEQNQDQSIESIVDFFNNRKGK